MLCAVQCCVQCSAYFLLPVALQVAHPLTEHRLIRVVRTAAAGAAPRAPFAAAVWSRRSRGLRLVLVFSARLSAAAPVIRLSVLRLRLRLRLSVLRLRFALLLIQKHVVAAVVVFFYGLDNGGINFRTRRGKGSGGRRKR